MASAPHIAVLGATGVVGRQVLLALAERGHPADAVTPLATERSAGEELEYGEDTVEAEPAADEALRGMKAVVLAVPPAEAARWAQAAQRAGAWTVDLAGAFRGDADVPLHVPHVLEATAAPAKGLVVTLAHPASQAVLLALAPLREAGLLDADVTALVGAASAGLEGVRALEKQTADLMGGRDPEPGPFPHRLGFNLLPQVGALGGGRSAFERALLLEVARALLPKVQALSATAFQVPIFHGISLALSVRLEKPLTADAARALLKAQPGVKLLDDAEGGVYPMPMLTASDADVHVGRVRAEGPRLQLVACVDAVGRAAATAVDLALRLSGTLRA